MDRTILTSKDMQMILVGLRSLDSVSGSRYYGQLMEKIQTAIEHRHLIGFKYYAPSRESNRRIEPYYLVFQWSN